jgi:hypothetical protein
MVIFIDSPKGWLLLQRFGADVDHLVADLLVLCPRWNQAPAQLADSAVPAVSKNVRDRLARGDIEPRLQIKRFAAFSLEFEPAYPSNHSS